MNYVFRSMGSLFWLFPKIEKKRNLQRKFLRLKEVIVAWFPSCFYENTNIFPRCFLIPDNSLIITVTGTISESVCINVLSSWTSSIFPKLIHDGLVIKLKILRCPVACPGISTQHTLVTYLPCYYKWHHWIVLHHKLSISFKRRVVYYLYRSLRQSSSLFLQHTVTYI